jgi:hypothetical protein
MSELLSLEAYQSLAERLEYPTQCFIDGEFRDAISGETYESINPATGEVVILPMMYLALSYDHRMIDGKEAVQFLVTIKDLLEDPARMLLDV